jgi:hypothetical protein
MRLVDSAPIRPGRCAVLPQIAGTHPQGFIDTGSEMPGFDNHVYVSVVAVEQMARLLGWPSPAEQHDLAEAKRSLEAELTRVREELAEADRVLQAIDTLESRDFRARRKPGRPRNKDKDREAA